MLQPGRSRPGAGSPEGSRQPLNRLEPGRGRGVTQEDQAVRRLEETAGFDGARRLRLPDDGSGRDVEDPGQAAGPGEMVVFVDRGQVTPVGREAERGHEGIEGEAADRPAGENLVKGQMAVPIRT